MTKRAGIYVRISEDREGAGLGVTRQRADCETLVERLGWTVAAVYCDNDISAYSGKVRPEYRRLLDDLKNGTIDAVVAWHPDRLHRRPVELEEFIDTIEVTGAAVEMVTAGKIDLATPSGRFVARTIGNAARYESEHSSERKRRKHLELAQNGAVSGGGVRPYGYDVDRVTVRPDEAELIQEAASRFLAGESLRGIAMDWNERGIPTVSGKTWAPWVLGRVLASPRIAGLREHRGAIAGPAVWPAIIDRPTHDKLRAILTDPARRSNRSPRRYFLSGGILKCGRCGAPLISRPRTTGKRSYCCAMTADRSQCGRTSLLAEPLENLVAEMIFEVLDSPEFAEAMQPQPTEIEDHASQIAEDEAALEQLAKDHYVDRLIGRAEFLAARDAIQTRIDAAKRETAQDRGTTALIGWNADKLRQQWPALSLDQKQAITKALFDKIVIGPVMKGRNTFDPGRVQPVWRY